MNPTIAFTLGHEESYDQYLRESPKKLGFREVGSQDYPEGYQGGTVWKEKNDAILYIQDRVLKDFAVYSIQMPDNFEKCAHKNREGHFDLLIDCPILKKEK